MILTIPDLQIWCTAFDNIERYAQLEERGGRE